MNDFVRCLLLVWMVGVVSGIEVSTDAELRAALVSAQAGDEIVVMPGVYRGGIQVTHRSGTLKKPIRLIGAQSEKAPVLKGGGSTAIQFSNCSFWVVENLVAEGFTGNGFNFDDGGTFETPSRGMVLRRLHAYRTGPDGNHDGIKLSGLVDFRVDACRVTGWGGSAIDMVGCRDGVVSACLMTGATGFSQNSGIQMKGGTKRIVVEKCQFKNAGERAVNLGGSTGLEFFRPEVGRYEAEEIEVRDCVIEGSEAAVAFVGSRAGKVHHNLIIRPSKWALRILQEQPLSRFAPCESGEFSNNVVVLPEANRVVVNVGPNTKPETFVFRRNAWFHEGRKHRVVLPSPDLDGVHGVDPIVKQGRVTNEELSQFGPRKRWEP